MNLILSQTNDVSTGEICEWFYSNRIAFQRINVDSINLELVNHDKVTQKELADYMNSFYDLEKGYNYEFCNDTYEELLGFKHYYKSIWFRRPNINLENISIWVDEKYIDDISFANAIKNNKKKELYNLYEFVINQIQSEIVLGSFRENSVNKLLVLKLAKKIGLSVPETLIVSNKDKLIEFISRFKNGAIAKSIYEPIHTKGDKLNTLYTSYTFKIENHHLNILPNDFSPSLVQENLAKEFEIRAFYLAGEFYSMAIFSQENAKTSVDFRNYDLKRPNRNIPFELPIFIKEKLSILMNELSHNCGSIDIVKTKNGEYVFLEVNPVGQFGMVSVPCNYNLDFEIFKYLKNGK